MGYGVQNGNQASRQKVAAVRVNFCPSIAKFLNTMDMFENTEDDKLEIQGLDIGTLGNTLSGCVTQDPRVGIRCYKSKSLGQLKY